VLSLRTESVVGAVIPWAFRGSRIWRSHGGRSQSSWTAASGTATPTISYWDAKIKRTQERDRLANQALHVAGWQVLRFWDFEIEEDVGACVQRVSETLDAARTAISLAPAPVV